jgi:hypothetical protein
MAPVGAMFDQLGDITVNSITIGGTPSAEGWSPLGATPDTITANGNGSYDLVFNGTDLTDTISEGMRIRSTRTAPASNTSFSLDGTNDYYVKTSPNKMTFTDDFAVGFWIYPTAYGNPTVIASRYNGTSGWQLNLQASGQVLLAGHNAGVSNVSYVISYQSVPLNKWTHVAAQLDMSTFTATTTTSYVMINGVDVPAQVIRGGTNPTALVQAGNFEIGSANGGTAPFAGYIGDGGVFSAKVTQATMLGYMNQGLVGTETNLASGYANGSVNDLNTTTPNNLTATNGATTVANAPYGNRGVSTTIDYGIVMKKAFSTNTTLTVQVPEGCTIPTSGGVSSVDYSTQAVPYGFPRDKGRWTSETIYQVRGTQVSPTNGGVYNLGGRQFRFPVGAWSGGYDAFGYGASTGAVVNEVRIDLNATNATYSATSPFAQAVTYSSNTIESSGSTCKRSSLLLSSATVYYLNYRYSSTGTGSAVSDLADMYPLKIVAENAYL